MTNIALFIDHENLNKSLQENERVHFYSLDSILYILQKEKIIFKKIFFPRGRIDSSNHQGFIFKAKKMGFEVSKEVPNLKDADPYILDDAYFILYQKPEIDTFVICSGDKDFIPLIKRLIEMGKGVIMIGVMSTTSDEIIGRFGFNPNFRFIDYTSIHRYNTKSHNRCVISRVYR